jgi:hypothetical protein
MKDGSRYNVWLLARSQNGGLPHVGCMQSRREMAGKWREMADTHPDWPNTPIRGEISGCPVLARPTGAAIQFRTPTQFNSGHPPNWGREGPFGGQFGGCPALACSIGVRYSANTVGVQHWRSIGAQHWRGGREGPYSVNSVGVQQRRATARNWGREGPISGQYGGCPALARSCLVY